MSEPAAPRWRTQVGIGAALLGLAAIVWFDATSLPAGSANAVGPAAAMRLIAVFVAGLGVAHGIDAHRRRAASPEGVPGPAPDRGNHGSLAWVLGGLFGLIAILQFEGGFIAGATWLFVATARGFGQRVSPKSFAIGLILSTAVYAFFTKALSLGLPAGPLERLFG